MFAKIIAGRNFDTFKTIRTQFTATYGELPLACCLCSGLEIISSNDAFLHLVFGSTKQNRHQFFNRLFDHDAIETLFGNPGVSVQVQRQVHDAGPLSAMSLCARTFPCTPSTITSLWLVTAEDLTQKQMYISALERARARDPRTGTLLPNALERRLREILPLLQRDGRSGLYCEAEFILPKRYSKAINREVRDDLMTQLNDRLHSEFGIDTLITRRDALAFSIFLSTGQCEEELRHVVNQVCRVANIQMMQSFGGGKLNVGAARFPADAATGPDLIHCAGLALQSKQSIKLFDPTLRDAQKRLIALASDMNTAIESNEISPHFQPVVDPRSGAIKSFEALIRWQHPELGFVSPPDIIQVAQTNGLMDKLTYHVLDCALAEAQHWPDHVSFAVNVTPSQLTPELVDCVHASIKESGCDATRLEIEVTEDALIGDFERAARIFARLRAIGVSIAMDDFGAGYTSVGNLRLLNFNKIKIDKTITDGLPDDRRSAAIVRSLMFMANELDMVVTVEGVEDTDQLTFLQSFDCGIQGYVFSPPLPSEKLRDLGIFDVPSTQGKNASTVLSILAKSNFAQTSDTKLAPSINQL